MFFYSVAMNISFGQKIPIYQTQVLNKETNQFQKATLYELDCKDYSDIEYLINQKDAWEFKYPMTVDMHIKNMKLKSTDSLSPIDKEFLNGNKFFVLESPENELIGLCEITGFRDRANIQYLETNKQQKEKYKFSGQSILASVAKLLLSRSDKPILQIYDPAYDARKFYREKCGFADSEGGSLVLTKAGMENLVSNVEQRTQGNIIDLQA